MGHVRMRTIGLVVVAALAVAAYAAGSAAALPEWGRCEVSPTHEGKYTDSNCTTKAKKVNEKFPGEYEWHNSTTFAIGGPKEINGGEIQEPEPLTLTSTFIKCEPSEEKVAKCREGETEERVPVAVECENIWQAHGIYSPRSAKEITLWLTQFKGCKALGMTCGNDREGEIDTNALKGVLGYIKKTSPKEVGIDWKPESGREVAKFACGGAMSIVVGGATEREGPFYPPKGGGGGVIATVTPINEMVQTVTQVLRTGEEATKNIPSSFEGKPLQALESYFTNPNTTNQGSKWGPTGETLTEPLKTGLGEYPTEIKA
jgi:hypothetical protein